MGMQHPPDPLVFISYSHEDEKWLQEFLTFLKPLKDLNRLDCWSDIEIDPGRQWREEIERALNSAKIAVLLVSPYFLASDYIKEQELPRILHKTNYDLLKIIWIPVSDSNYEYTEIVNYQAAHDPAKPLDTMRRPQRRQVLRKISKQIDEVARPYLGL